MIGRTLGNYRIIEQIGLGGMATVFKGYDPDTDRYVAIKILPQHFSHDPQFRERFKREAKAIAKLEHLHILPIFAYGEEDGIAYMAMRYLQGGTLTDRIAQGPLPFAEAQRVLRQLASALDHAHSQNILHRDMKPSNVLLDNAGNAYLMDFGIAKIVEATVDLTGDRLLGTPAYMSPEQCKGDPIGPASDIYSLGIILYEMVTGRRPFHAETPVAVILQQLNDPLPPPRQNRPDLPEKAENVIFKALAKNPESRYKTAGELAAAFARAIATADTAVSPTRPAPLPPPAAEPAMPETPRRLPNWAWGVIGVLAAAALITLGIFLANQTGDDETPQLAAVEVTTAVPAADEPEPATAVPNTDEPKPAEPQPVALPPVPKCEPDETELFFDDFEDGSFRNWDTFDANGNPSTRGWYVTRQEDNHVLVGLDHNWANAAATFGQDYSLHLRLRHASYASSWHLNIRMGENGRYFISPEALKRDPGERELAAWPPQPDTAWHVVSIIAQGNHFEILRDGHQLAAANDPEPLKAGIIALENTAATVWYDDIRVCARPNTEPAADAPPGNLHFIDSDQRLGQPGCGRSSAIGDLNGDGTPDIFLAHNTAQQTWLNDGHGRFTKESENETDAPEDICSNQAVLGDVDGDGDLDALVGIFQNDSGGDNLIWLNDGHGRFSDSGQRLGGSHSWDVALADLDGDGDLDIFDASGGPSKIWLNEGDGRFTNSNQSLGSGDSVHVALGDLDGDQDLDAFVANFNNGEPNEVFLNDGDGRFQSTQQPLGQSPSIGVALGDLDGDGDLDAFVANGNSPQPNAVWLNEGHGRFSDSGQRLGRENSWAVALADLDNDGDLDAFIGNGADGDGQANTIWLNNGQGQFSDSGLRLGSAPTRSVILVDLDGDGDYDVFTHNDNDNKIWFNEMKPR